jgi:hypothetical protein
VALLQAQGSSWPRLSLPLGQPFPFTPFTPEAWPSKLLYTAEPPLAVQPLAGATRPLPAPKIPITLKNSSKFCGIIWDVASQAWRAKIKVKGKTWYLGIYKDEGAAARAYDAASWFIYGPRGTLNFIDVNYDVLGPPRTPPLWLVQHLVQLVGGALACARPAPLAWLTRGERACRRSKKTAGRPANHSGLGWSPIRPRWQVRGPSSSHPQHHPRGFDSRARLEVT